MYAANAANQPLDTDRIVTELERTSPLSVVMREQILQLRAWAADRTVPAD
jgi:hypothetical protein